MKDYFDVERNRQKEQILKAPFEEELDSTFTKLEEIQDEIVNKKIATLEAQLQEIEDVALSIIKYIENKN